MSCCDGSNRPSASGDRVVGDKGETFYVTSTLRNYNKVLDRWELVGMDATGARALRDQSYQNVVGPLIAPDRTAFRTSSIVARPPGAVPPHSNRVSASIQ